MMTMNSIYTPTSCLVTSVADLTPTEKLFRLRLLNGEGLGHEPGQFVEISLLGVGEAPISVASSATRDGYFELVIRRVGSVTTAMHKLSAGDTVGVRGPFGTSFKIQELRGKDLLLIAGGCGFAPMRSLIQYCEDRRNEFGKVVILYGAKSPADVLFKEDIAAWEESETFECHATVDDLPEDTHYDGNVGLITTLIPPLDIDAANASAVIVGPPAMYKLVINELKNKGLDEDSMIVSLERYMKCGVGKCGHCAIEHLHCCTDGPVFKLSEISHVRGAI